MSAHDVNQRQGVVQSALNELRGRFDEYSNNFMHYLVLAEADEVLILICLQENLATLVKYLEHKNSFGETPIDWAFTIKDRELRERFVNTFKEILDTSMPNIWNYQQNFNRQNLYTSYYYSIPSSFTTKKSTNIPNPALTYISSLKGKNKLISTIKQQLIPCKLLYHLSETFSSIITKGNTLDPRFKRAYLHIHLKFGDRLFTASQTEELLKAVKEDASNINATIKGLSDAHLIAKLIPSNPTKTKSLYRLKGFYEQIDKCPEPQVSNASKEELTADYLLPLRALGRWLNHNLTVYEYEAMLIGVLDAYEGVYKGNDTNHYADNLEDGQQNPDTTKTRGRKKFNTEVHLWGHSAFAYASSIFTHLKSQGVKIDDEDMLCLCLDLLQGKLLTTTHAKSFELSGFIAHLIKSKVTETCKAGNYQRINLVVATAKESLEFLVILLLLKKLNLQFDLYINHDNNPPNQLLQRLLALLGLEASYFTNTELNKLPVITSTEPYNTDEVSKLRDNLFVVLFDVSEDYPSRDITPLLDALKMHTSLFMTILPKVKDNDLLKHKQANTDTKARRHKNDIADDITAILRRYDLQALQQHSLDTVIKLADNSLSGLQINYCLAIHTTQKYFERLIIYIAQTENYPFKLAWLKKTIDNHLLPNTLFILEYPVKYLKCDDTAFQVSRQEQTTSHTHEQQKQQLQQQLQQKLKFKKLTQQSYQQQQQQQQVQVVKLWIRK